MGGVPSIIAQYSFIGTSIIGAHLSTSLCQALQIPIAHFRLELMTISEKSRPCDWTVDRTRDFTRVTEPSNIRWFEKFDIRSSNIEYRTIEPYRMSNLFESSRYSINRTIEYRISNLIECRTFFNQQIFDRSNHRISNIELRIRIFIEWFGNPTLVRLII